MKRNWTLAAVLALMSWPSLGQAQSADVTEISFPSDGFTIQGRFFASVTDPVATLLLLPPGDLDPTNGRFSQTASVGEAQSGDMGPPTPGRPLDIC